MTPFEVLFGVKMKHKEDIDILNIIEQESVELFNENRYDLRITARENIQKIQEENRRTASKITKLAQLYKEGDIVAIKRTQFGTGLKISPKFYGPYKTCDMVKKQKIKEEEIEVVLLRESSRSLFGYILYFLEIKVLFS